ncbi:hypothetical protein EI545_06690 [Tabrizicola piscis]|uniref:Uncharacterized protein n=1 Tax=Tabrizicola piscis TaxID=2494374 RepID=A0A3S8U4M9_9RHOB|nr:hypothetical protein [Tabrizicola piscis]AZL58547.1 hypothetical protein EI545_06690 [Tabrizicola piscis]
MTNGDLKDKLAATADKAKDTAASAMDVATDAGRAVKDEVKAQVSEKFDAVRDAAGDRAGAARDSLVGAGDRLAETLQAEAQSSDGVSARMLSGLAGGVSTVTDGLRGRTLGDILAGAQDYARRNPGTFAVGAAVAGFALARFLRSSSNRQSAEEAAAARAADATDRLYRDAARRTVDTQGLHNDGGSRG